MVNMSDARRRQIENRNTLTSIFVVILIGVAYQEAISPVRESVRASGITLGTSALFSIFFMTSLRFFIGNQLHLSSERMLNMKGAVWFYDMVIIILQTTIIVFLGGVSSVEQNRIAKVGFTALLVVLYAVDVLWIITQWVLGRFIQSWRRSFIPWAWCILNTTLIVGIVLLGLVVHDLYSNAGLIGLLVLNGIAFIVDVILVDYHDML